MTKEELEKENAELKEALRSDKVCKCSHYLNFKDLEKKIAELEKDNAELKEELEEADNATDCFNKQEEIIAKAKELLKNLLSAYTSYADSFDDRDNEIVSETEQFLSEVEK